MKSFLKIALSLILVILFVFSTFMACSNNEEEKVEEKKENNNVEKIDETDLSFIKDKRSDYKIVVGENAEFFENYACDELNKYLLQSTGCKLNIVKDNSVSINDKIISIGNNAIQKSSNVNIDKSKFGSDGFIIKTIGDDIFILGGSATGTVYAVYEFLTKIVSFEVYAPTEIYYTKTNDVPFYNFDIQVIPSFATRSLNSPTFHSSGKIFDATLMRMSANDANGFGALIMNSEGVVERDWGLYAHSIGTSLLPWSKYHDEHPEWFDGSEFYAGTNAGYQINMTNDDVINEVAENLKTYFEKYPTARYFMVGINDNPVTNSKDKSFADANGGYGGVYINFLNKLDNIISKWLKDNNSDREYNIVGLAYENYKTAPVDANGNPASNLVKANKNVGVMYCPIDMDWGSDVKDQNNEYNKKVSTELKNWNTIVNGNLFIWTYSVSFKQYLIDFNNFATLRSAYNFYKDNGVVYLFDQGVAQSNIPFKPLRDYLQSKLMWDNTLNTDTLINNFIDQYYKVAAPYIKELYYSIRLHYKDLADNNILTRIYVGNNNNGEILKEEYWSYTYCTEMMGYINKALNEINSSSLSQDMKNTLISRVSLDSIMPRYIILSLYRGYMTSSDYGKMVDEFEADCAELNVKNYCETYGGENISSMILDFRGKIKE